MTFDYDLKAKSDEELMVFYQKDHTRAFELLYQRYSSRILVYLRQKTKSDKTAQDLLQEVFLKLHRSREQYNQMLPFAPWIFSISRSVFLDHSKKRNLEDVTVPEEFDRFLVPEIEDQEQKSDLLGVLPEAQRNVVSLRVYDEATFEEIAAKLSTSPENARQLFSRGVKKLKSHFGGRGS